LILELGVGGKTVSVDKQSVIHPTSPHPRNPPTHRHCVGWKTAKPFPRVPSRLLARVGPVGYASNQPVFQRIQMHIVDVMSVITLIWNQLLPIAPLPDTALAARALGYRPYLRLRQAPGKRELDGLPAQGEIRVAIR